MILSHDYRFIFVKPKKVAGTSLEILLSQLCGAHDIITPIAKIDEATRSRLGFPGPQNYRKRLREASFDDWRRLILRQKTPLRFYNHIPATEIKKSVGDEIWNSYLTISIVRNPFDYAISRYYWKRKSGNEQDFTSFLRANPQCLTENRRITDIDGRCEIDFMVRYENLQADLTQLSERLGLDKNLGTESSMVTAKSGVRPVSATMSRMYSSHPEALDIVRDRCRHDIERYGYDLPSIDVETLAVTPGPNPAPDSPNTVGRKA
ncbi:MAG: hypothetical protein CL535_13355 [Ahrensia sp.]|nr:hypothetical protein [Ahrensia sp.]|tara:strand:+ start:6251 stop:7039 length:789 start_codon:yes stop_codon:yes gene_type:complete